MLTTTHINKRDKAINILSQQKNFTAEEVVKARLVLKNSNILMSSMVKNERPITKLGHVQITKK